MEDRPLVSVIVPVYGVEPYLRECVDSILSQTYKNIEIVLVDDGSPDGCGEICDEYARHDHRVTVLHKENGGLSDARNQGLRHSTGDWVAFIDSDDFVSPRFIECLYETAIACGCKVSAVPGGTFFKDGDACKLEDEIRPVTPEAPRGAHSGEVDPLRPVAAAPLGARETIKRMLYQDIATGAPWRLYRREVLGEDPFPVGLYYEDLASTYLFVMRAGSIALLDSKDLYAYRVRADSIIHQEFRAIKAESALVVVDQLNKDITNAWPELAAAASSRCFLLCRMVYAQIVTSGNESPEIRSYRSRVWEALTLYRRNVLFDSRARKRERVAAAVSFLGEKPFCAFCRLCRRMGMMR